MTSYKTLRTTDRSKLILEYGRLSIKAQKEYDNNGELNKTTEQEFSRVATVLAEKLGLDNNLLQNAPIEEAAKNE